MNAYVKKILILVLAIIFVFAISISIAIVTHSFPKPESIYYRSEDHNRVIDNINSLRYDPFHKLYIFTFLDNNEEEYTIRVNSPLLLAYQDVEQVLNLHYNNGIQYKYVYLNGFPSQYGSCLITEKTRYIDNGLKLVIDGDVYAIYIGEYTVFDDYNDCI